MNSLETDTNTKDEVIGVNRTELSPLLLSLPMMMRISKKDLPGTLDQGLVS